MRHVLKIKNFATEAIGFGYNKDSTKLDQCVASTYTVLYSILDNDELNIAYPDLTEYRGIVK